MFGLRIVGTIIVLIAVFLLVRSMMRDGGGGGGGGSAKGDPSPKPDREGRRTPAGRV